MISVQDLAKRLEAEPQKLRKFLRANFPRQDKGKKWEWSEGDLQLQDIEEAWKKSGGTTTSRKSGEPRRSRAQKRARRILDLNLPVFDPVPSPDHIPCTWCQSEVTLADIYVKRLDDGTDQKIAVYQCTKPSCGIEYDQILTLHGWLAPQAEPV